MTTQFYSLITNYGEQVIAQAVANNTPVPLKTMAIGDGNGSPTTPNASQTKLQREVYRAEITDLLQDSETPNQVIAELLVPETVGGFTVREVGIYDEHNKLIAVANCPENYKPVLEQGSGKVQYYRIVLRVSSSDAVTLSLNNNIVYATRVEFNQFVNNLGNPDGFKFIGQCESIEQLLTIEPTEDQQRILVKSYHTGKNLGGGVFYADFTDTTTADNGGTVIVTTGGKRWKRAGVVLAIVEEFGALGDKKTDDSSAFLAAVAFAKANKLPLVAQGKYKITQPVDVRELAVEMLACDVLLEGDGQLIIGGHGNSSFNPDQKFGRILYGKITVNPEAYTRPSIQCIGSKGQTITVKYTDYFQMWMSTDPATYPRDASQAYSTFNINFMVKLEFATDSRFDNAVNVDGAGSANQWCNENIFNLNRCFALIIGGSYRHNCNYFVGGSFEGDKSYIDVQVGNKNRFVNTRLENVGYIRFGEKTEGNILERSYFGSTAMIPLNVEDSGVMNRIETASLIQSVKTRVLDLNPFTPRWNNQAIPNHVRQVGRIIRATANYGQLAESEWFAMKGRRDVLIFDFDNPESQYQVRVYVRNALGKEVNPKALEISSGFLRAEDTHITGSPIGGMEYGRHRLLIMTKGDFYLKIELAATHQPEKGLSRYFAVDLYSDRKRNLLGKPVFKTTRAPTQYVGFKGDVITFDDGKLTVDEHIQTEVSSVGSNYIVLPSVPPGKTILLNDTVGIESDIGETFWSKVTTVGDRRVNLNQDLPSWVKRGDSVYISRFSLFQPTKETILWQGNVWDTVTVELTKTTGQIYILTRWKNNDVWHSVPLGQVSDIYLGSYEYEGQNSIRLRKSGTQITLTPTFTAEEARVLIKKVVLIGG